MPIAVPYAFTGSFLLAIFALQWWQHAAYPLWLWAIVIMAGCVGTAVRRYTQGVVLCVALGTGCALLSMSHSMRALASQTIPAYATGRAITVTGTVSGQPDDRQTKMLYTLIVQTASGTPATGRMLVTDRQMRTTAAPGDLLEVTGTVELPGEDEEFSYRAYLAAKQITAMMNAREIRVVEAGENEQFTHMLWRLRMLFEARIAAIFPEPSASLLAGLLTGSKRGLPERVTEDFRITGLSHIVAISGSNITIVISLIAGMLFFLPQRWRLAPSIVAIVLFTLFVGAEASVVRASIMGILGLIAVHTGRLAYARLSLVWTACFMLIWNPLQLSTDMGFQLSFLAVIGLVELQPLLQRCTARVPQVCGLREALQTTLCAQLTAMPWAAYRFGQLSLIAPLPNILVAPLVPLAMLSGFVATLLGWLWEPLGYIAGLPASIALELILTLTELCARIPYAAVHVAHVGAPPLIAYYLVLLLVGYRAAQRTHPTLVIR